MRAENLFGRTFGVISGIVRANERILDQDGDPCDPIHTPYISSHRKNRSPKPKGTKLSTMDDKKRKIDLEFSEL